MYPPNPPEYIEGTPEYAARVAAQQKDWEERLAREEQERLDAIARKEALAAQKKADALAEIERSKEAFAARVASFGGGVDEVFTSQAQLLHGVFTHAIDEFAGSGAQENKAKLYSNIALRAQNYCRMTLSAMVRMKEFQAASTTLTGKKQENEDPAIKEVPHETMDVRGAPTTGGIDPQLAAVEDGRAQNGQG